MDTQQTYGYVVVPPNLYIHTYMVMWGVGLLRVTHHTHTHAADLQVDS